MKTIGNTLERLWQDKEHLTAHEKETLFMMFHQNNFVDIFRDAEEFYLFCLKDLDISRFLKPDCI